MATFTASARLVPDTLMQDVDVNGRHTILTDEPESLGGSDYAPTPHELLPAALASCISTMVALYARRNGWSIEGLRVEVTYDSDAVPCHLEATVLLPDGLTEDQIARLTRVAETCPVGQALRAGFTVDEHVRIRAATA